MKRYFLLPLLALLCVIGATAQNNNNDRKKFRVYGVAFYNLENLFDTINNNGKYDLEFSPQGARQWDGQKYWSKINNLARCITSMTTATTPNGPAVIGVSEIENKSVLDDLVKTVDAQLRQQGRQPWNLQVVHHDSPDRRGVDVACLYNPAQFQYMDVSNTTLTIPGNESFRTRDQMCVTGRMGGDVVSVIVNHWPSRLGGQEQSSYLREAAGSLSKHIADSLWRIRPGQGVIVMGDLNDDPHDRSCSQALGAKKDIKGVRDHGFYNPFWKILDKGIGTLAYKGAWNLFDQIIVSGTLLQDNGASLYFKNAKVNNFDFLKDTEGLRQNYPLRTYSGGVFLNGYSDHFPTEIFLVHEATTEQEPALSPRPSIPTVPTVQAMTTLEQPAWSRNAVIYEVNWRQMTDDGTLRSLMAHLPRIKELGADIIWMMPVHPISEFQRKGDLGSYYAVKDFLDVNPELGTKEEFRAMVDEAHRLGLKVIIDWVPDHSGCDNAWVTEHPDWYERNEQGEMFGPFDWTDVFKFDYSNPEMAQAMTDAMLYWIREMDVDGFRCDVAMLVPTTYWNAVRPVLDAAKEGGIFMLAEASNADLVEHAFNMVYNWPMKDVFNAIAATSGQRTYNDDPLTPSDATAIDRLLESQAKEFAVDSYFMNMITNHDLNSWEGTEFQRLGNLTNAFAVLEFTLPGMPLIYTGQETGMDRAFEFFVKDTPPTFEPKNEYYDFYRRLIDLKHNEAALAAGIEGGRMYRYPTADPNVYVFSRSAGQSTVLVMVNLGSAEAAVEYTGQAPAPTLVNHDYLNDAPAVFPTTLRPGEYRIFTHR